jgi:hypothetical protein
LCIALEHDFFRIDTGFYEVLCCNKKTGNDYDRFLLFRIQRAVGVPIVLKILNPEYNGGEDGKDVSGEY